MGNKEKYCKVLEDVLGNKLGGTKYKELGSNLGLVTASYLKEKLNENGITSGPYFVMGSNLIRKISKMKDNEAILTCITESLMANSGYQL